MPLPPGYRWRPIKAMPDDMPGLHLCRESDDELMASVVRIPGEDWLATINLHRHSIDLKSVGCATREEAVARVEAWITALVS